MLSHAMLCYVILASIVTNLSDINNSLSAHLKPVTCIAAGHSCQPEFMIIETITTIINVAVAVAIAVAVVVGVFAVVVIAVIVVLLIIIVIITITIMIFIILISASIMLMIIIIIILTFVVL